MSSRTKTPAIVGPDVFVVINAELARDFITETPTLTFRINCIGHAARTEIGRLNDQTLGEMQDVGARRCPPGSTVGSTRQGNQTISGLDFVRRCIALIDDEAAAIDEQIGEITAAVTTVVEGETQAIDELLDLDIVARRQRWRELCQCGSRELAGNHTCNGN